MFTAGVRTPFKILAARCKSVLRSSRTQHVPADSEWCGLKDEPEAAFVRAKKILPLACLPHHQETVGTCCAQDVRKTGTRGPQDLEGGS